jgi:hypothetical protein
MSLVGCGVFMVRIKNEQNTNDLSRKFAQRGLDAPL